MPYSVSLEQELIPLLQTLIRNACVNDGDPASGNESRSVAVLRDYFRGMGLEPDILAMRPGRDNLVLRIRGKDPGAPSLAYMGHLDVVPADGADWSRPPFSGERHGGEIWGRGAVDMLNMTASMAVGVANAWREHGPFPGDLCFFAVADEEASGHHGAQFLLREHAGKVRADYMIAELGGFYVEGPKGPAATITLGEKGIAWIRAKAKGSPGHGSMPYRSDNAVVRLSRFCDRVARGGGTSGGRRPHALFRSMVRGMSANAAERFLLSCRPLRDLGLSLIAKREPGAAKFLHTASRMTVSPNLIKGGGKINIIADRASLDLDCRLLPGMSADDAIAELGRRAGRAAEGMEFEVLEYFPSTVSPAGTPLMDATAALEGNEGVPLVPMMIGGVTDGRFWRREGTVVYGYCAFAREMTMERFARRIHGRDERISEASLARHLEYFSRLPGEFWARASGAAEG